MYDAGGSGARRALAFERDITKERRVKDQSLEFFHFVRGGTTTRSVKEKRKGIFQVIFIFLLKKK